MSVISGIWGAEASKSAAETQYDASTNAAAIQAQMYNQGTQALAPYVSAGTNALAQMQKLQEGDLSSFYTSPGYEWTKGQGLQGIQRAASATGRLGSGAYLKDATKYAEGLASQEFTNFYNRYQNVYQGGQSAAARQATNALQSGENAARDLYAGGAAQAAGTLGAAQSGMNALRTGANFAYDYYKNYGNPFATNAMGQYAQYGYNPNWTANAGEMDAMSWL